MAADFPGVARSQSFRKIIEQAERFAAIPRPLMLRGERGTGKELLARYIHATSPRAGKPFIAINCASLNHELLSAEIYGHEKGAFTGAHETRPGKLEQADGGTLFLDEIGNMSGAFQGSILRVVEYQEFTRVRGTERIRVDVRFISATNANLEELMAADLFRQDLYDRLAFAVLEVPPLRRRREDIPQLVVHFVQKLHEEIPDLAPRVFSQEAVEAMLDYYWPGNIREMKNLVERVYLYGSMKRIMPADLPAEITGAAITGDGFAEQVEAFKQQLIITKLGECNHNQRQAAAALKMTYDQFRHYYRKYQAGG